MFACTLVVRRMFDAAATMELVDRYQATGLSVVPAMLDRIMELPDEVRNEFSGRSLRFVSAAGSRMRPDVVIRFMDQFGDVVYNNYNATEVGVIALAGPADLRAAPDTAGSPMPGTEIRILGEDLRELPRGQIGQIFARTGTEFDGYTSGQTKLIRDGFMASGDLGYLDADGRLFVVGRDDEMIVSGGENVYPIEVEKALASPPSGGRGLARWASTTSGSGSASPLSWSFGRARPPHPKRSSSMSGRTWRTTRCLGRSCFSTSCPATPSARSSVASCGRVSPKR